MVAVAGMQMQTARAGDRGWATAGKILTGVAIGAVIANAVDARASYSVTYSSGPGYAYCPPPAPVVCVPAPVVCAPRPVVYVSAPVVCAPPPVVVYRAPVFCAPPVVSVRYAHRYGHGYSHDRGHHGWR